MNSNFNLVYANDYVYNYVLKKTGVKIRLDLQEDWVTVRAQCEAGNITLAMFWVKVLQHPDNFPSSRVHYHKGKEVGSTDEKLYIRVEDVVISVNLRSGTLKVAGAYVLQWFKERFLRILQIYDGLCDTTKWYDSETREIELKRYREEKNNVYRSTIKVGLDPEELVTPLEMERFGNLFKGDALEDQFSKFASPSFQSTQGVVYPMIKSLLARWLSDPHTQLYAASTHLDQAGLRDLFDLALLHKTTAQVTALHVPFRPEPTSSRSVGEVRTGAVVAYGSQDQLWLEYKVLEAIKPSLSQPGSCYYAGVKAGQAEVLVTSASLCHAIVCDVEPRCDFIQFFQLKESLFMRDFVQPLTKGTSHK